MILSFYKWLYMHTYTCRHKYSPAYPLITHFYWNSRARSWHLEDLGWIAQLTIWKSHQVFSKNVLNTANLLSTCFQVAGISYPPPINLNPFSIHLAQCCLTTFSVQLQEMASFSLLPMIFSASRYSSTASFQYFALM